MWNSPAMRSLKILLTLLAAITLAAVPAACGGDDDAADTTPTADAGDDDAAAPETDDADDSSAGSGSESAGPVDVPDPESRLGDLLMSTDDFVDPDEAITTIQVLGGDRPGYIDGTTIVAQATDETGDISYICVAKGQLDLDTYTLVVLDRDGTVLDDC